MSFLIILNESDNRICPLCFREKTATEGASALVFPKSCRKEVERDTVVADAYIVFRVYTDV